MKIWGLLFGLLVLCAIASAQVDEYFQRNIFYRGDVLFDINNQTYDAGDTLQTQITAVSLEDFPIAEGFLVIDVVEGGAEHIYPSQLSDAENIIYEKVIGGIDLEPRSSQVVPFSYVLPVDLKSGDYRLEVYLTTGRTPVVGIPSILISPRFKTFRVESVAGVFSQARILRTTTIFGNESGPIGVGVDAGSKVEGAVHIGNDGTTSLSGSTLSVKVCEWDDSTCGADEIRGSNEIPVPPIAAGNEAAIDVSLDAPKEPSAYAVRLELKDQTGRTLSIYRSRIVVMGPTAKIRKLASSNSSLQAGEKAGIYILVGASPDHYNNPVVENATVEVTVSDTAGKEIFSASKNVSKISVEAGSLVTGIFEYTVPQDLEAYTLCSTIRSSTGLTYDKYCIQSKAAKEEAEAVLNWSYDQGKSLLYSTVCSKSPGNPVKDVAVVLIGAGGQAIGIDKLLLTPCGQAAFEAGGGEHALLVTDSLTGKQTRYDVNLTGPAKNMAAVCGDGACATREEKSCCSDCGCPGGASCKENVCTQITTTTQENKTQTIAGDQTSTLLIAAVIIIVITVLLLALKKRRPLK